MQRRSGSFDDIRRGVILFEQLCVHSIRRNSLFLIRMTQRYTWLYTISNPLFLQQCVAS